MDKLNLSSSINKDIKSLSFSEKKRLDFVRTILVKPKAIIAVDPFDSLDDINSNLVLKVLNELNKNKELLVIILSSSPKMAAMDDYDDYVLGGNRIFKGE